MNLRRKRARYLHQLLTGQTASIENGNLLLVRQETTQHLDAPASVYQFVEVFFRGSHIATITVLRQPTKATVTSAMTVHLDAANPYWNTAATKSQLRLLTEAAVEYNLAGYVSMGGVPPIELSSDPAANFGLWHLQAEKGG